MAKVPRKDRLEKALETIDESKRSTLRKLVLSATFMPPAVASFSIGGMKITSALAAKSGNSTQS